MVPLGYRIGWMEIMVVLSANIFVGCGEYLSVHGRPVTGGTQRINMCKPSKALPVDSPFNDKPKATTSERHQLQ